MFTPIEPPDIALVNLVKVDATKCELEGPYECPHCGFHMMLDSTYLDQVELEVVCPSCREIVKAPEEA